MPFSVSGPRVADFEEVILAGGAPGLGFLELVFSCRFCLWSAHEGQLPMSMDVTGGLVQVRRPTGNDRYPLGRLHVQSGCRQRQDSDRRESAVWQLVVEVPPERMAALA